MKKGVLMILVVALMLAVMVPAALALTDNQKTELEELYEQQQQLQERILEKQAEFGIVDDETAAIIRERMAERWEYKQQRMSQGDYTFGAGRGRGFGKGGGMGRNGGGCGNYPVIEEENVSPTSAPAL